MLHYYAKKSFSEEPQKVEQPPTERAWVYGSNLSEHELDQIGEAYGLDQGILNDVKDRHELPRAEFSDGALYVFVRNPKRTTRATVTTTPFLAVLKDTLLITLSTKAYVTPKEFFEHTSVNMHSTRHLFLQLLGYEVHQYEMLIHETGKYVNNTARRLRAHEVKNGDFVKFVAIESDLNTFATNLSAMQVLLSRLHENRHKTFVDKDCEYIEDMDLLVNQLLVSAESYAKKIESIRNAYTTISNNILNQRMKTLTLLTLLIALPNVFYGMYGMNVPLPFQTEPWAYFVITGFTLCLVAIGWMIVRKMRF